MMTSSKGNIFRVTGHLNSSVTGEFPAQRPVTWSFDVFFHLRLIIRLSKQSRGWWFETPSRPLWRHCDVILTVLNLQPYPFSDFSLITQFQRNIHFVIIQIPLCDRKWICNAVCILSLADASDMHMYMLIMNIIILLLTILLRCDYLSYYNPDTDIVNRYVLKGAQVLSMIYRGKWKKNISYPFLFSKTKLKGEKMKGLYLHRRWCTWL